MPIRHGSYSGDARHIPGTNLDLLYGVGEPGVNSAPVGTPAPVPGAPAPTPPPPPGGGVPVVTPPPVTPPRSR